MTMNRKIFALMAAPIVIALSICANPVMVRAGDDFADLAPLLQAEKDAYLQARDALLKERSEPWDVNAASNVSWELGLAAFILNERLAAPDAFEQWDKIHPILHANGVWYHRRYPYGSPAYADAFVAFLLEKMWKGIPDERDREYAAQSVKDIVVGTGETSLWNAIWEHADNDQLRFIALQRICADPDPSAQPIILDVLGHDEPAPFPYSKSRCLDGLFYRDTEQSVDAILSAWEVLSGNHGKWIMRALGALSRNSSPRAREPIYEFILDDKPELARKSRSSVEMDRRGAVAMLCSRPRPDDVDVIRQFLAGPGSVKMKSGALQSLGRCPIDYIGSVLREVLTVSDNPQMISWASFALAQAYGNAMHMNEAELSAARAEDALLLEEVLKRHPDLPTATRVHLGMRIEGFRAKPGDPRPRLPDRPPDP